MYFNVKQGYTQAYGTFGARVVGVGDKDGTSAGGS